MRGARGEREGEGSKRREGGRGESEGSQRREGG